MPSGVVGSPWRLHMMTGLGFVVEPHRGETLSRHQPANYPGPLSAG